MSSNAQPPLIMIIRHGEKPGNPDDDKGGPDLSVLGSARAAAIPSLFVPNPTTQISNKLQQLVCDLSTCAKNQFCGVYNYSTLNAGPPLFSTPNFLFATAPTNSSSRPLETITPLVQALQFYQNNPMLTINANFTNDPDPTSTNGVYALAAEILDNPSKYGGQNVLISWHHGTIPLLAERFGVGSQLPWTKWPPTVFDLVLSITGPSSSPTLSIGYQQLLYGDTTAPSKSS